MTSEEKLFLAKFEDKAGECERKNIITFTSFMDMNSRSIAKANSNYLPSRVIFYSPFENDERQIAVFLPEYVDCESAEELKAYYKDNPSEDPVAFLQIKKDKFSKELGHRDYLGSVMGLGIKREMIGDIKVADNGCTITCLNSISDYICKNLVSAGRSTLKCEKICYYDIEMKKEDLSKEISFTVSSLRLDSIVKNAFNLSRGDASTLIETGLTYVNDIQVTKSDKKIVSGDKITVRHKGRIIISDCSKITKKGRIAVVAFK